MLPNCARVPGPSSNDWVLEELSHEGSLYLVDPKTNKMFTVPSGSGGYPRPVGERTCLPALTRDCPRLHALARMGARLPTCVPARPHA